MDPSTATDPISAQEIARKQAIAQLEVIDTETPRSQESDLILCEMIQNHFVPRSNGHNGPGRGMGCGMGWDASFWSFFVAALRLEMVI